MFYGETMIKSGLFLLHFIQGTDRQLEAKVASQAMASAGGGGGKERGFVLFKAQIPNKFGKEQGAYRRFRADLMDLMESVRLGSAEQRRGCEPGGIEIP